MIHDRIDPGRVSSEFAQAIRAAGLTPPDDVVADGRIHRFSTSHKRHDTGGWYVLYGDGIPAGVFGDYRQGLTQTWCYRNTATLSKPERQAMRERARQALAEREKLQDAERQKAAQRNRQTWQTAQALLAGDAAHRYLLGRGIDLQALPGGVPQVLRLHPAMAYYNGTEGAQGKHPAMLAAITSPTGNCVALHRTYLQRHGDRVTKLHSVNAKKMTHTSGSLTGSCIALFHPTDDGVIGVAEGIETALACTLATGIPTVAAVSANGVKSYRWPDGVTEVIVFADNDASGTGQEAARVLFHRVTAAGLRCTVHTPTQTGTDWADAWAKRAQKDEVSS